VLDFERLNAVANPRYSTNQSALVTIREMPIFHEPYSLDSAPNRYLAISETADRQLWKYSLNEDNGPRKAKRYKAVMKQVAGVPFTGVLSHEAELEIIETILAASKRFNDSGLPVHKKRQLIDALVDPLQNR